MSNWVGSPSKPESRLAVARFLETSLSYRIRGPRTVMRILCSYPSPPESAFPSQRVTVNDIQMKRTFSVSEQAQRFGIGTGQAPKTTTRVSSISSSVFPTFPDDAAHDVYRKRTQNGAATSSRSPKFKVSCTGKWQKPHDSSLSEDEPLPLPMTWPNSKPASREQVNELLKCDPETQTCKEVIYQWTGDCKRCQGTGLVSFDLKNCEVTGKCINCVGIGSVHKITLRADVQDMDGTKGNPNGSKENSNGSTNYNGSARGSPGTNGKA